MRHWSQLAIRNCSAKRGRTFGAVLAIAVGTHRAHRPRQPIETLAQVGEAGPAGGRQGEAAARAAHQFGAEIGLERLDLQAHGRRRDVKLVGRLGHAQMARDAFEGTQGVQRRQTVGHGAFNILVFLDYIRTRTRLLSSVVARILVDTLSYFARRRPR